MSRVWRRITAPGEQPVTAELGGERHAMRRASLKRARETRGERVDRRARLQMHYDLVWPQESLGVAAAFGADDRQVRCGVQRRADRVNHPMRLRTDVKLPAARGRRAFHLAR